jgi:SAM-dependent methyltransferase
MHESPSQARSPSQANGQLQSYVEASNRNYNRQRSATYRREDETALARGGTTTHYGELIRNLAGAFNRPIDVLDVGCGTGRYFHSLTNTRRLVGLDTSPDMLEQARHPVREELISAQTIELVCGDVFSLKDDYGPFDLIYSVGVLGEFAPIDAMLLQRLASLLKPDGVLFTTAVDTHSRLRMKVNGRTTLTRRGLNKVFRRLPPAVRVRLNRYLSPCYVTRADLEAAFRASNFTTYTISAFKHSPGWRGTHFDCIAYRQRADVSQARSAG